MSGLRVYFDSVDSKWRIKGYEEYPFSTLDDAQSAVDFAAAYAPDLVSAMTGNSVPAEGS